jgi:amidase
VRDVAILLGAMAGPDPHDAATRAPGARWEADYTKGLDGGALRGVRLGVARKYFGFSPAVDGVMKESIEALKRGGAVIVDPVDLPTSSDYDPSELEVLLYEFKADLNVYLGKTGKGVRARTLADLIRWNDEHKEREMPFFGQELFHQAQEKGPLTAPAYRKALAKCRRHARTLGIDAHLAKHRLDALVAPSNGPAWVTDFVNGDHYTGGSSTPAAVAGYPSLTVPAGMVFGLPVGITFFGRAWSEAKLLRIAYAFERATKARRKPGFVAALSER